MSRNTQLPVAVHILVALTLRDEWLSSESLAWSIDTNASMVRRILASLNRAGLVVSRPGRAGGVRLAKGPRSISLLAVLRAVDAKPSRFVHTPNPECPLGAVLSEPLQQVLDDAEGAAERALANKTVHEVARAAQKRIAGRRRAGG